MEIYKSKFLEIIPHQGKLMEFVWSDHSAHLTDEDFRQELLQQVKMVEQHKPAYLLIDTTHFMFAISPDVQTWIDNEVYPAWAGAGVVKIALLMSSEFIAQLSVEQAIDENTQKNLESNFFESKENALSWFEGQVLKSH